MYVMSPIQCAGCGGAVKVPAPVPLLAGRCYLRHTGKKLADLLSPPRLTRSVPLRSPGCAELGPIGSQRSPGDAGQFEAAGIWLMLRYQKPGLSLVLSPRVIAASDRAQRRRMARPA